MKYDFPKDPFSI